MFRVPGPLRCIFILCLLASAAFAEGAAFDLSGPQLDIKVTRAGRTLPIAQVPSLQAGDRLWLHPAFPDNQSVRFVLVAAFLRGTSDAPPDTWFTKAETWTKAVRQEGIYLTIPEDAQQVVLLLAPESAGGFSSLRSTIRGKPGAFVRASQDLMQASLDRLRLDKYLAEVKATSSYDPKALHERSVLLARSLSIKLNEECFDRPAEEQSACLTRNSESLVLDDDHTQSMVATLTSGANSDLIGQLSNTRLAGGGVYSSYVGVFVDLGRILGNLHTPEYRYIPALSLPRQDQVELKLNNPPSFRKPKSVIVIGLPPVKPVALPPVRPVDSSSLYCLQKQSLVLPIEGSPAIFATGYGHDLVLRVQDKDGASADLPVTPDPARGGLVLNASGLAGEKFQTELTGTVHGFWGFQAWEGPAFLLRNARAANWAVVGSEAKSLIVGRNDALRLQSEQAACVEDVKTAYPDGREFKSDWKVVGHDEVEVQVPLTDAVPGPVNLLVKQAGLDTADQVLLQTYSEAPAVEHFAIHAGDQEGVLTGKRLDQVKTLEMRGLQFSPEALSRVAEKDELKLAARADAASGLHEGERIMAQVTLVDGRVLDLPASIEASRPKVLLLGKSGQPQQKATSVFQLGNKENFPQDEILTFFLKSLVPEAFPRTERVEVAATDGSFQTTLTVAAGDLVLQDAHTVLALLDPTKRLGNSAFGPLRFRAVTENGVAGDWQPLVTLVRTPALKELSCPAKIVEPCLLTGTNLFLIDSLSANSAFSDPVSVPIPFADSTLAVPHPKDGELYIKLRDDPTSINSVTVPVVPLRNSAAAAPAPAATP